MSKLNVLGHKVSDSLEVIGHKLGSRLSASDMKKFILTNIPYVILFILCITYAVYGTEEVQIYSLVKY